MPMPLSDTVMVRAWASTLTRIFGSGSLSKSAASVIASKRSLSPASDAFDTSSRRKISLLPYKECTIRWSSCLTSAWKPRVSLVAVSVIRISWGGSGLCVRALRCERLEERSGALVDWRRTAGPAAPADAHRHVDRRAALLVLDIQRRATFGEQRHDGIETGLRGEMDGGQSVLVRVVDVYAAIEQQLGRLAQIGLGPVILGDDAEAAAETSGHGERVRASRLRQIGVGAGVEQDAHRREVAVSRRAHQRSGARAELWLARRVIPLNRCRRQPRVND